MLGQSWNPSAITALLRTLRSPQLLIPHLRVENIAAIDFKQLQKQGIKCVCFDKDNTLSAPYKLDIADNYKAAWSECLGVFGSENIVIVSNSAGSKDDINHQEARLIEQSLNVHVLRHKHKKPDGTENLLSHFPRVSASEIAVIGDRVLTDIVYGNSVGALTILVKKVVTEEGDNRAAALFRRIENNVLLPLLDRAGVEPPPHFIQRQDK